MKKEQTLLDEGIQVLIRLRTAYHGDTETQGHINAVLDKLYFIKY